MNPTHKAIAHKARLNAKPNTGYNPNNLHLVPNLVSHKTWKYFVLVIHFIDESYPEVTSLQSCEVTNLACTNYATSHLYSCIFQIWAADSLLHHYHYLIPTLWHLFGIEPTTSLEATAIKSRHGLTNLTQIVSPLWFLARSPIRLWWLCEDDYDPSIH